MASGYADMLARFGCTAEASAGDHRQALSEKLLKSHRNNATQNEVKRQIDLCGVRT